MPTRTRVSVMQYEVHSFSRKGSFISFKLKSRSWGPAVGLACLLTCNEQHAAAAPCRGQGWLQTARRESHEAVRHPSGVWGGEELDLLKWCSFGIQQIHFLVWFKSFQHLSFLSSPKFPAWLKLLKRNEAGLLDSILVLGLVKFTLSIFFLKRVGDAHPKEKKKGERKRRVRWSFLIITCFPELEMKSKTTWLVGRPAVKPAGWQHFYEWGNPGFSQHGACSG